MTRDEYALRTKHGAPRQLEPRCVFGGYTPAWSRWWRSRDGWEQEHEDVPGAAVYPTEEACREACQTLLEELRSAKPDG